MHIMNSVSNFGLVNKEKAVKNMYIKVKNYGFQVVNPKTKKGTELLENYYYRNYGKSELYQVYGKNSDAKQNALDYCKMMQYELNGYDGHITTYNTFVFCYAFTFICDGVRKIAYITPTNNYIINDLR